MPATTEGEEGFATNVCRFCGRELEPYVVELMAGSKPIQVGWHECDCPEATEERRRAAEEAAREREEGVRRERRRAYERAGVPSRYLSATTSESHRSLYVFGPVGVGKTYLASALAMQAVDEGRKVRMVSSVDMLAEIRATYRRDAAFTEDDVAVRYGTCEVLVLDDLGKEQPTEWALQSLYRIVDMRYTSMGETIVTSNHRKSDLIARLGGGETAVALASRLAEMCESLRMDGEDRRIANG